MRTGQDYRGRMLQAALNGGVRRDQHGGVPTSADALAADFRACIEVGVSHFHVHPRDGIGHESLEWADVSAVLDVVPSGAVMGVSTAEWIEPDSSRRRSAIRSWTGRLASASVNLGEPGSLQLMRLLVDKGIGIEAGIWTVGDVDVLARSGLAERLLRVLVEPFAARMGDALSQVAELHDALDAAGVGAPRLQHGDGDATWLLLEDALRRGIDTRIGLEDTLRLPDGRLAEGNLELVLAAQALGAGGD